MVVRFHARFLFAPALLVAACSADPDARITADVIGRDVAALPADSMEGRGTGTAGEERAARYIARRFEEMGLAPAGATYILPFELVGMKKNAPRSSLTLQGPGGALPLADDQTFTYWSTTERDVVDLANVPVVFVGYGVEAPEYQWDDFKGVDVSGKTGIFSARWVSRIKFFSEAFARREIAAIANFSM